MNIVLVVLVGVLTGHTLATWHRIKMQNCEIKDIRSQLDSLKEAFKKLTTED